MRHDKLERELRLLLLLIENHRYTVPEICEKMEISRRNFYYYLGFFRFAGFTVENRRPYYFISKNSPFFRKLDAAIHLTEDEAIMIRRILERSDDRSPQMQRLMQKLDKLYDLDIIDSAEQRERVAHNVSALYDAIKQRCTVVLVGYSSPHSNTTRDRTVEPFLFLNGNQEIRCYELSSKMNKTFKLSRIQDVKLLDDLAWSNERHHRHVYTDPFMFSDEHQMPVRLRMGRLATSILREEYPQAERYIEDIEGDADHWLCDMPVCSYAGIGRFVMGLYEDIEVLGDEGFKDYLNQKINHLKQLAT